MPLICLFVYNYKNKKYKKHIDDEIIDSSMIGHNYLGTLLKIS